MNYRHAFHAGNMGDCLKHALLLALVDALQHKAAPLFLLDTHAGPGDYDLTRPEATRTGEWRDGIGRLLDDTPADLRAYVDAVTQLGLYPGSPALLRSKLRPGDRLACCELHPDDYARLRRRFAADRQVGVHHRDAWEALGALLPPDERRGLVLVDPPYEAADEFGRLAAGLQRGYARFRTGVFAAWYPIKDRAPVRDLFAAIRTSGIRDVVAAEFLLRSPTDRGQLNGSGMVVINPPFRFEDKARPILAALLDRLGNRHPGEGITLTRLVDE